MADWKSIWIVLFCYEVNIIYIQGHSWKIITSMTFVSWAVMLTSTLFPHPAYLFYCGVLVIWILMFSFIFHIHSDLLLSGNMSLPPFAPRVSWAELRQEVRSVRRGRRHWLIPVVKNFACDLNVGMSFLLSPRQPESNRHNDGVNTPLCWANGKFIFQWGGVCVGGKRRRNGLEGRSKRVTSLEPPELKVLKEKQWEKLYVSSQHSGSLRQAADLYTRANYVRNGKQRQTACTLPFGTGFVWAKMSKVEHISACFFVLHDAITVSV